MTTPCLDVQDASAAGPGLETTIRCGNIYLSRELCGAHLAGAHSIALVAHGEGVVIVPLIQQSAGGVLLKVRNARGDRVLHAQEFLRARGVPEDFEERRFLVRWVPELSALAIIGVPAL